VNVEAEENEVEGVNYEDAHEMEAAPPQCLPKHHANLLKLLSLSFHYKKKLMYKRQGINK
jgi:hypothetical protein